MTVRQQIEALLKTGLRNCEISRQLNCRYSYVCEIRSETRDRKITATDRRIETIREMVATGKSDAEIADKLCVSERTVRHDRQKYGIRQRQFHRHHHDIVKMKQDGFKQSCIILELNVSAKTIRKAWERHLASMKNTGTKTASAGRCNQQVDMMTTTDLQSDRPSDRVSSM